MTLENKSEDVHGCLSTTHRQATKEEEGATHNLNMQQLLLLHCVELIAFTLDTHVLTHPYHTCTHTHNYTLNKFTQAQIHIYS